jgi:uncharacterized protein (DUF433 family)
MTRTLTLRFSDAQAERLERFARDRNADLEQTIVRLIDEALRMADHPAIGFRDSVVGRQAYLRGSTLAVWEVVMLVRERKNDAEAEATADYLGWPEARVEAALRYAAAYPEEIEAALRETVAVDADALRRLLPGTHVIDMHMDDEASYAGRCAFCSTNTSPNS